MKDNRIPVLAGLLGSLLWATPALAASSASGNANATSTILPSLGITKIRDLNFGIGTPGEGNRVVGPTDATNSASFIVTGGANAAYDITLPTDGTVTLSTGGGGSADKTIAINTFVSSPAVSGNLSAAGEQTLTVGATRAGLSVSQEAGVYSGVFTVTVTFQ